MRGWLKEARMEKGLTMKEVAEKLCISESYYCSIENGYRQKDMNVSLVGGISEILGIPLRQIFLLESAAMSDSEQEDD